MAEVIDIKEKKDNPKIGEEVDIRIENVDELTITKQGDFRVWARIKIEAPEALSLIKDILNFD